MIPATFVDRQCTTNALAVAAHLRVSFLDRPVAAGSHRLPRMKALLQRVCQAEVHVGHDVVGRIDRGLLVLVCVEREDTLADVHALARKIARLRVFPGTSPMDQNVIDVGGACLVVSQFTLAAEMNKGNRPGFSRAAEPEKANESYESFCESLREQGVPVETGVFGAAMQVHLINDGPVTLWLNVRDGRVCAL